MASITIKGGDRFPDGTVVSLYVTPALPSSGSGAPAGSVVTTGTLSGGAVTFTGLLDATTYVAYAQVGGADRYKSFRTDTLAPSVPTITLPAGAADSGANLAAAITLLPTGGHIRLAPGSHTWITVPNLPAGLTRKLLIDGPGALVTLSSAAPRFVDCTPSADYQTFQNIDLADLTIDANNTGGRHHVVIGCYVNGVQAARVNFDRINVRRVRAYNITVDSTTTNHRLGIAIGPRASAGDTQTSVTRITCEDVDLSGGNAGILISALRGDANFSQNVFFDHIYMTRCRHDMGVSPTVFYGSSNFQICGVGFGRIARMTDCYGYGSGDDGIEINAMNDVVLRGCHIENSTREGFFFENFGPLAGKQRILVEGCTVVQDGLTGTNMQAAGYRFSQSGTDTAFGRVSFRNCLYRGTNMTTTTLRQAGTPSAVGWGVNSAGFDSILIEGCTGVLDNLTVDNASSLVARMFSVGSTTAKCPVNVVKCTARVQGTRSSGTFGFVGCDTSSTCSPLRVRDLTYDHNVTGAFAGQNFALSVAGSTVNGIVDGLTVVALVGDGSPVGVAVASTGSGLTITERLVFRNCDFAAMTAGVEFSIDSTQKAKVFLEGTTWRLGVKTAIAQTVGASPGVYQNLDGYDERVVVQGGTVSKIETGVNGAAYYDTGLTAGVFFLKNGDYLRITYSVVPTVTTIPNR